MKEGFGWETPKDADDILLSLKVVTADRGIIKQRSNIGYMFGSGPLGHISKACEKTPLGMKKGEEAELKCSKDYGYDEEQPNRVTIVAKLRKVYETEDVSFSKDESAMKKQVKEG